MNKKQIEQRKRTFFTRTKSGIFIGGFYVVYFLLLVFSDPNLFNPIQNHWQAQFILNFFCVLMMVPIIYFVAHEITKLCFPGHKAVFIYTALALFVLTIGTSIWLLGSRYLGWGDRVENNFMWHIIICLSGIVFFTLVSTLVWIIMSRHIVYVGTKTRVWYPLLVFIINSFFVGFIYTSTIHGWSAFMFLILASTGCDVFAYVGGSIFGKHKLAPKVSPKKTWEGLLFGVGVTLAICLGVVGILFIPNIEADNHALYSFLGCQCCSKDGPNGLINLQPYYWGIYIFAFLVLMAVSVCGDLFFSFVKRRFSIKDFSNLLPGHGGMLDRLDALIFIFTFYFIVTVIIQLCMVNNNSDGLNFLWERSQNFVY